MEGVAQAARTQAAAEEVLRRPRDRPLREAQPADVATGRRRGRAPPGWDATKSPARVLHTRITKAERHVIVAALLGDRRPIGPTEVTAASEAFWAPTSPSGPAIQTLGVWRGADPTSERALWRHFASARLQRVAASDGRTGPKNPGPQLEERSGPSSLKTTSAPQMFLLQKTRRRLFTEEPQYFPV